MKALLIFLFVSGLAWADQNCEHDLTLGNATIMIQNDLQVIRQDYTIRRTGPNNERCHSYRLYFTKGLANSYQRKAANAQGIRANYNLHKNIQMSGTLKDFNDANSAVEFIEGYTPTKFTSYSGYFFVSVPGYSTQGNLPQGTYSDNIQIRVFSKSNHGNQEVDQVRPFSINLITNSTMEISLVDEGDSHNSSSTAKVLNFGLLQQNLELGADLMVKSNTAYSIRLSSFNNGSLKKGNSAVDYQLKINNSPYSLIGSANAPVTVANGPATGTNPARYKIKVQITGSTNNKIAGEYEDTITITAIAN